MKVALTIAGSDSGGGAGIQADLKTFDAHDVFGVCTITAITAQNTRGVRHVWPLPVAQLTGQLDAILEDYAVSAVKIGMLASAELTACVATYAPKFNAPIVLDPVRRASGGTELLSPDAEALFRETLLPLATLITPNIAEAEWLSGQTINTFEDIEPTLERLEIAYPTVAWLIKGGHLPEKGVSRDVLAYQRRRFIFSHPFIETNNTHGTGCTLASAIAARLALGHDLPTAVELAADYVHEALRRANYRIGHENGPLKHNWLCH